MLTTKRQAVLRYLINNGKQTRFGTMMTVVVAVCVLMELAAVTVAVNRNAALNA